MPETTERKFSKAQLLKSAQYQDQRDLLCALLEGTQRYSLTEVGKRIQEGDVSNGIRRRRIYRAK